MAELHIGKEIEKVVTKKGMTVVEFSRRITKARETVYDIFRRETIDTGLLVIISEVLQHDFFKHYTKMSKELKELQEENQTLKDAIQHLKSKEKKTS